MVESKVKSDLQQRLEAEGFEFLTNEYHLNPKPKLILIVEGNGEEEQFPRLSKKLFGYSFSKLGIEVVNIRGVAGFTGRKGLDQYGALEKFIDYYWSLVNSEVDKQLKIKEELISTINA